MIDLYCLAAPFIKMLDPEAAHGLAIKALRMGLVPTPAAFADPVLEQSLWGRTFANPVGLAAGFDKNAEVADAMLAQGFGFVEIGIRKGRDFRIAEPGKHPDVAGREV